MKLIIGLGNPEVKYKNTRHNAGLMVVDELISNGRIKNVIFKRSDKFIALKSAVFMNDSGSFVAEKLKAYHLKPESLYVIHDDLDIPLGSFKIQFGKGPKVHNGLNDIYDKIGSSEFWHVRIGIDSRASDQGLKASGSDYVLQDFSENEKLILERVIKQICNQLVV